MIDTSYKFLPHGERKKILLISDDLRSTSGVGTMSREFVLRTAHHFNWVQLGAGDTMGQMVDLSEKLNKESGLTDSDVRVFPRKGYGDQHTLRYFLETEKPDAILIFTDPRFWIWLFEMEREVRSKIPIFYLNIWDNVPYPIYNRHYYNSVDVLMAISKLTKNVNEVVLGEKAEGKVIEYVPHGVDHETFSPILETHPHFEDFKTFREKLFTGKTFDYVVFYNSRNLLRKKPIDLVMGYRMFCEQIGEEAASRCALVLHTDIVDPAGTDLVAVRRSLTEVEKQNIFFSTEKIQPSQLNLLYNVADVTILPSYNEGWGLSMVESLAAGTMIIGTVTGGIQDQMRFEDEKGNWISFTKDFPSNHRKTYEKCGEWAIPMFPSNISLSGGVPTPYIYDDRVSPEEIAEALLEVYKMSPEERKKRGLKGREWVTSEESGFTAEAMGRRMIDVMDMGFEKFKPRSKYSLVKIGERESEFIKYKLIYE